MSWMRLLLLLLFIPNLLVAQMIDPKKGDPLSDKPFYDDEFIKWQQIKSIKGSIIYMLADGSIVNTNYSMVNLFDTEGRLIQQYEAIQDDGSKDTTWNFYKYDENSQLVEHKKCFGENCSSYQEEYDDNGFITIKQAFNIDNAGKTTLTYRDSLLTFCNDTLLIQKYFNNSGAYFYTEETQLDYMKRPISKSKRYFYSSEIWNEMNQYNNEGKLSQKIIFEGANSLPMEKTNYTYDSLGNLLKQELFKNEILFKEAEFLCNEKGIIESIISQDYEQGKVTIIRFSEISFY
jgi:hypothetical protein